MCDEGRTNNIRVIIVNAAGLIVSPPAIVNSAFNDAGSMALEMT